MKFFKLHTARSHGKRDARRWKSILQSASSHLIDTPFEHAQKESQKWLREKYRTSLLDEYHSEALEYVRSFLAEFNKSKE